jgi:hypothetical protein
MQPVKSPGFQKGDIYIPEKIFLALDKSSKGVIITCELWSTVREYTFGNVLVFSFLKGWENEKSNSNNRHNVDGGLWVGKCPR